MIYGERLSEKDRFGQSTVELKKENNSYQIYIQSPFGEQKLAVPIDGDKELRAYPVFPVHTPERITHYLLYRLETPVSLPPEKEVVVSIQTLIEVGVAYYSKQNKSFEGYLFFIPPYLLKYALYGQPNEGLIVRDNPTKVIFDDVLVVGPDELKASTRLRLKNDTGHPVVIKKVLVNTDIMSLYMDNYGNMYTNDVTIIVQGDTTATVMISRKPPLPGLKESPQTRYQRLSIIQGFGVQERKVPMQYGY